MFRARRERLALEENKALRDRARRSVVTLQGEQAQITAQVHDLHARLRGAADSNERRALALHIAELEQRRARAQRQMQRQQRTVDAAGAALHSMNDLLLSAQLARATATAAAVINSSDVRAMARDLRESGQAQTVARMECEAMRDIMAEQLDDQNDADLEEQEGRELNDRAAAILLEAEMQLLPRPPQRRAGDDDDGGAGRAVRVATPPPRTVAVPPWDQRAVADAAAAAASPTAPFARAVARTRNEAMSSQWRCVRCAVRICSGYCKAREPTFVPVCKPAIGRSTPAAS